MSKGKNGNKETKKPKKVRDTVPPRAPAAATPGAQAVASLKKNKW